MSVVSARRPLVLFGLILLLAAVFAASPAQAHSELRERAPAADSVVGEVTHIDLLFWTPIAGAEIQLFGPDQVQIETGETTVSGTGLISSIEFDPLTEPGRYAVTHTETSIDTDVQTAAFTFEFDPTSEAVVASLLERPTGPNWVILAGVAGVVLVLAGLFAPRRSSATTSD
jgi:methionine-rich copper-binding protein CopC